MNPPTLLQLLGLLLAFLGLYGMTIILLNNKKKFK